MHQGATVNNIPEKLKKNEQWRKQIDREQLNGKRALGITSTGEKTYQRFCLAENQLKTAIRLFLTEQDRLSAITLAGAADVIFCELVNRDNKKNFTDILRSKDNENRSRADMGKEINDLLNINSLKHFDETIDERITFDVNECAIAAILKALANYSMLKNIDQNLIIAFRYWVKKNLSSEKYGL